jgi:hypothetical protein
MRQELEKSRTLGWFSSPFAFYRQGNAAGLPAEAPAQAWRLFGPTQDCFFNLSLINL